MFTRCCGCVVGVACVIAFLLQWCVVACVVACVFVVAHAFIHQRTSTLTYTMCYSSSSFSSLPPHPLLFPFIYWFPSLLPPHPPQVAKGAEGESDWEDDHFTGLKGLGPLYPVSSTTWSRGSCTLVSCTSKGAEGGKVGQGGGGGREKEIDVSPLIDFAEVRYCEYD